MKSSISVRIPLFGLIFLVSQSTSLLTLPAFIHMKPREIYIACGTVVGTALACTIWSNKHHPAALAAKQLEIQQEDKRAKAALAAKELEAQLEEQRKQERKAQALEEQRKLLEAQKLKAQALVNRLNHAYESEINLLPNNQLVTQKDALFLIIKSKCNTHKTPLTHYHEIITTDLEELRKTDPNHLDTEKNNERLQLISKLERILRTHNLVIADAQKLEQENAKIEKRKEEAEKRKIEKETLEIQKDRLKIENYHETQKINSHIRTELRRVNDRLDTVNNKLQTSETNQAVRAQQSEQNMNQVKIAIANHQDAITKKINEQTKASDTSAKELAKMLNEFKKFLENIGTVITTPRQPPFNPEVLQAMAAPAPTYPSAPAFNASMIQPIPVPGQ